MAMPQRSGLSPEAIRLWIDANIWDVDVRELPFTRRVMVKGVRIATAVGRDIAAGQLNLRAMSLVYTTLLSLVPLLAISFSVLKGFGVHNQIEPMLLNVLAPLGDRAEEITARTIEFVENIRVGVLGSVGLALLFYTVVSLMQKIERAFNYTWHVTRDRTFARRFSEYLTVILVGPVLIFTAMGITGLATGSSIFEQLTQAAPVANAVQMATRLIPFVLFVAAFTFLYVFIPNTKVQLRSAFVGGLVAGLAWNLMGWAFTAFVVGSAKYAAIYSAFATLVMFMIWLYLSWLVLLIGAAIAFYHQNPQSTLTARGVLTLSAHAKERMGLLVAYLIAHNFYSRGPVWSTAGLADRLRAPVDAIDDVLDALAARGLVARTDEGSGGWLPARPPDETPLSDVFDAVRAAGTGSSRVIARLPRVDRVEDIVGTFDESVHGALDALTLKDLVQTPDAEAGPPLREVGRAGD